MESRGSDFYNANQLENDEAKRRVIPNLPRRPQPTFIEKTNNQTNPANTLDTSFQSRAKYVTFAVSRPCPVQRLQHLRAAPKGAQPRIPVDLKGFESCFEEQHGVREQ